MQNRIPHFTFSHPKISNGYVACIEKDGQPIHQIKNPDAFYKELGYTAEMRMAGVLPDEFLRNEGNSSFYAICFEMRIIDYLAKNSISFIDEYGYQYQNWLDNLIEAATEKNLSAPPCRTETFCNIGMPSFKCQRI